MITHSPFTIFYQSDLESLPDPAAVWQSHQLLLDLGQDCLNCVSTHRHVAMPPVPLDTSPKT